MPLATAKPAAAAKPITAVSRPRKEALLPQIASLALAGQSCRQGQAGGQDEGPPPTPQGPSAPARSRSLPWTDIPGSRSRGDWTLDAPSDEELAALEAALKARCQLRSAESLAAASRAAAGSNRAAQPPQL
jgi:hypothetical protein